MFKIIKDTLSASSVGWDNMFSLFSACSLLSAFSTLSIASSFSLLSIGSHQSILSVGCNNRLLTVCNWKTYAVPNVLEQERNVQIDRVDSAQCEAGKTAVYFSVHAGIAADYEMCSVDEGVALACSDGTELSDTRVCLDEDRTKKDRTLFVQTKKTSRVQAAAHMLPRYQYNRASNYNDNYYEVKRATIIFNDAGAWGDISNCTYEQKDDDICDWKDAVCIFDKFGEQECKAKRKGNGSWRDIDKKPSIKVKWSGGQQYKLTFNNNVQEHVDHAQVKAYNTFRSIGIPAPRAHSMLLRFGPSEEQLNAYLEYTQVEEIDEVEFLGAHALDGASVFELDYWDTKKNKDPINQTDIDSGPTTFKLGPAKKSEASVMDLQRVFAAGASLTDIWGVVNQTNFFLWYAGLLATNHQDSGCTAPYFNNMYVVRPYFSELYMFVPWGTDNTMRCPPRVFGIYMPSAELATCNPMISCFKNRQCSNEYRTIAKDTPKLCGTEHSFLYANITLLGIILGGKLLHVIKKHYAATSPDTGRNGDNLSTEGFIYI